MRDYLVKLKPISPFHIGEPGIGLEESQSWVPADLLFSAFCNAYGVLFGKEELESLIASFLSSPPFLLSSAFPFYKDVLLFPPPLLPPKIKEENWKDLKEYDFIPYKAFSQWIKVEEISFPFETFALPKAEVLPAVTLDRGNMRSQIYHRSAIFFPEDSGLFFLLRLNDENCLEKFKVALRFLGEMGIGGERSLGFGYFQIQSFEEISLFPPPAPSSPTLTLSPVIPSEEEEIDLSKCYYNLCLKGGWTTSPFQRLQKRKKRVWMLSEGSVFPKLVKGKLVELTPNGFPHKVYRYAFAFPVGVMMDAES
ncbi:MAG: type III-A CRISPR-associated RAMP protein Csm4 [bacterium]